jgi:hypothetical protein
MTRHGTLAYYLAAWVCGCFFMSSAIFLRFTLDPHRGVPLSLHGAVSNFWLFTFVGLIFGIGISLVGSFLIRRVMNAFHLRSTAAWMISGAILAPVVVAAFGYFGRALLTSTSKIAAAYQFVFGQAGSVILDSGWWLTIPVGALAALVLFRVDRAFGHSMVTSPPSAASS